MQAFFAAKSEIFFFFSEGAPPKLRAVPAAVKQPPCPLPAAVKQPLCPLPAAVKQLLCPLPADAPPLSEKNQKKISLFL